MQFIAGHNEHAPDQPRDPARRGRRHQAFIWLTSLVLLTVLIVPALMYAHDALVASKPKQPATAARTLPADLFIQSVVKDDGALGWRQLCPALQAQLPMSELEQQANAQRQDAAQHGLRLTSTFVGASPRTTGGELRDYVLTAHWSDGTTEQRTYTVLTQASGCVEDVTIQ